MKKRFKIFIVAKGAWKKIRKPKNPSKKNRKPEMPQKEKKFIGEK